MGTALAISACTLVSVPLFGQSPPQSVTQPVQVVNTPNVNVANTPSVSVTNTPSVSVSNTPSVNVTNTPSVNLEAGASVAVTNPPDSQGNPTPLATLEAVQVYGSVCQFAFNGNFYGYCYFTEVPSGKQLVVQEFDAYGVVETGNRPLYIDLDDTIDGYNFFTSTFMNNDGDGHDYVATHQETRLYVAPGELPSCLVAVPQNSHGGYQCNISGFLVDVPLGSSSAPAQRRQLPALPRGFKVPGR